VALTQRLLDDDAGRARDQRGRACRPQIEGRFDYTTPKWGGTSSPTSITRSTPQQEATWLVGRPTPAVTWTLQGNAYIARGWRTTLPRSSSLGTSRAGARGFQAGYALNTKWSVWGFYGTDRPDSTQLFNATLVTEANNRRSRPRPAASAVGRSRR